MVIFEERIPNLLGWASVPEWFRGEEEAASGIFFMMHLPGRQLGEALLKDAAEGLEHPQALPLREPSPHVAGRCLGRAVQARGGTAQAALGGMRLLRVQGQSGAGGTTGPTAVTPLC